MHYWCLLYSSVLVKKSLQNSRGGKMMLCFRLLACLASAASCVLGEHECGQRPRWAILMFPHSSWGKNEESTFKHTSSITIAALNTEIVCSWGASVLFACLFLHTDWICFTHLHSRESHKWMKYSRCILCCLQGRKASSSIRVNEGCLRSHWTGFWPHRGIKVASKVPDLAHKDDIWDGYKFFWKDKEDEGRYFSTLVRRS